MYISIYKWDSGIICGFTNPCSIYINIHYVYIPKKTPSYWSDVHQLKLVRPPNYLLVYQAR